MPTPTKKKPIKDQDPLLDEHVNRQLFALKRLRERREIAQADLTEAKQRVAVCERVLASIEREESDFWKRIKSQ